MLALKNDLKILVSKIIQEEYQVDVDVVIEQPKDRKMGDLSIPCFAYAKELKKAPNIISQEIANKLSAEYISLVEIAGGYINVSLNRTYYTKKVLEEVLEQKSDYGTFANKDLNVIVEYSSPNIAKPFHIGHIRTTVIGACLHRLYIKNGFNVIAINHLGDYGTQFGKLIVAIKNWGDKTVIAADPIPELLKLYIKFHEEAEANPILDEQAREWFVKLENNDPEAYELWLWIREISLIEFNRVYDMLGIKFDSYAGESFYSDKMPAVLEKMKQTNVLVEDDGAMIVNLEAFNMPNALITKKDGSSLYITRDLTAATYRYQTYKFHKNIYVVGHQQELHFKQWMKILELMGEEFAKDCVYVSFGTVSLAEGSLSTRSGRVVFLEDVLNKASEKALEVIEEKSPNIKDKLSVSRQVGIGAVIFQELFINRNKDYEFSWDKTLSFEGETGPYLQYTAVRIKSIVAKYNKVISEISYSSLDICDELWYIIIDMLMFDEIIESCVSKNDPSILAKYVIELAQDFNRYYAHERIIDEDVLKTELRVSLSQATYYVIEECLRILGINVPNQM